MIIIAGMTKATCKKCGHDWQPRAKKPLACPKCKSYDWGKA